MEKWLQAYKIAYNFKFIIYFVYLYIAQTVLYDGHNIIKLSWFCSYFLVFCFLFLFLYNKLVSSICPHDIYHHIGKVLYITNIGTANAKR